MFAARITPRKRRILRPLHLTIPTSMQTRSLSLALILAGLCSSAHAGLNKCKGPNGHPVYQNAPCPPPASAYARKMPTLAERNALVKQQKLEEKQRYADDRPGANWDPARKPTPSMPRPEPITIAPAAAPKAAPGADMAKAMPGAAAKNGAAPKPETPSERPDVALAKAKSRSAECQRARQQLGILQDGVGLHTVNDKGQRNPVTNARRESLLPEAQRRVYAACN